MVVADSIQTPANMGMILRVADNVGCGKVIFVQEEFSVRKNKIKKTAQTSFKNIPWEVCTPEELDDKLPATYRRIAIDTVEDSVGLYEYGFPPQCAFFVGNEAHGISPQLLATCTDFVHIPMPGNTISMNVSHALAVVLFEWVRRSTTK